MSASEGERKDFVERVDYGLDGHWIPVYPQIVQAKGLTPLDALVFGCLRRWELATVDYSETRTKVSVANVGRTLRIDERSARRCLNRLAEHGLLRRVGDTKGRNGRGAKAEWVINRDTLHSMTGGPVVIGKGPQTKTDQVSPSPNKDGPDDRIRRTGCPDKTDRMTPLHKLREDPSKSGGGSAHIPSLIDDVPSRAPRATDDTSVVRRAIHDTYATKLGWCHDLGGNHAGRLAAVCRGIADKRCEPLEETVRRAVLGYLTDPYWGRRRWPLNGLLNQAPQHADPPTAEESVAQSVDRDAVESKIGTLTGQLDAMRTDHKLAESMGDAQRMADLATYIAQKAEQISALRAMIMP